MAFKKIERNYVIVIGIDGSRGVDYLFGLNAFVILDLFPWYYAVVMQALSRGCRKFNENCFGALIVCEKLRKQKFGNNCKTAVALMDVLLKEY